MNYSYNYNTVVQYKRTEIFQTIDPTPEPCYVYIRKCDFLKNEISFSVLDKESEYPDFSNCGVFTISIPEFFAVMIPLELPDIEILQEGGPSDIS